MRAANRCPKCGTKTKVTRTKTEDTKVIRDRACPNCGYTYKTVEQRAERDWVTLG